MRRLLIVLAGVGLLAVLISLSPLASHAQPGSPATGDTPLVLQGEQLFRTYCASCHGENGGGTVNGPALTDVGGAADVDFVLRTGRMPLASPADRADVSQTPVLTPAQIEALDAWATVTLPGYPVPATPNPSLGNVSAGAAVFAQNCAACHGKNGAGGALGGGLGAPSLRNVSALDVAEAVRTGPGPMPVLYPNPINSSNIDSLTKYVLGLRHIANPGGLPIGGKGPVPEGWAAWIIGLGVLILLVRVIGGSK